MARQSAGNDQEPTVAPRLDASLIHISEHTRPWLEIGSLDELYQNESVIVERINSTLNGGYLFMTNPFLLFDDIGVSLSKHAREELLELEPSLGSNSETAYQALSKTREQQSVRFHLRGLFQRRMSS